MRMKPSRFKVAAGLSALLLASWSGLTSIRTARSAAPRGGSLQDPNIRTVGRWDKSSSEIFHSHWSGAYLRVGFSGTSVGLRLAQGAPISLSIDGEPLRDMDAQAGLTTLNSAPLVSGWHTLLVASQGQNIELQLQGIELDAGASTRALPARPIIEFVGDSISVGVRGGYCWMTGEALGADHVQIAFSARALTSGFGCGEDKAGLDTQYFQLKNFNHASDKPPTPWNFSYTPRVVIINLGQNDQCGSEPEATMTTSMTSFIRSLRARFAQAQIVVLRPFGGPFEQAERKAVESLRARGDKRVSFVDTSGWLEKEDFKDGIHPNELGNLKVTRRLAPMLKVMLDSESAPASLAKSNRTMPTALTSATVGYPNNAASLAQEIQNAYNAGARRITIRAGKYLLPATGRTAFSLDNWQDATLSARGVTIVMSDHKWGANTFSLNNCANVTIDGPTLTQTEQSSYQGRIVAVGKGADGKAFCDWKPDSGYPVPPQDATKFPSGLNVINKGTRLLKLNVGDYWGPAMESQPGGVFRIHFDQPELRFGVGDWIVGRYGDMGFKVWLSNSRGCTLQGITMMRNGFSPIREEGGGGNHILACKWALAPRPEGASEDPLVSGSADGLHSTGASPGPHIENCTFEGVILDDCIAIHGSFQKIKSAQGNTLIVEAGGGGLKIGDPARISNEKGFFGQAIVTALQDNGDKTWTVTLDQVLGVPQEAKLSNPRVAGPGFRIIGNHLGNTRSRGILTKSDDGLFQNNTIEGCGMAAISIGPEYYWNEADYSQHVRIEGNTLRGNGKSGYGGSAILIHGDGAVGNRDIQIKGNRFEGNLQGDVEVGWAESVQLSSNTMSGPSEAARGTINPHALLTLANSRAISMKGNVVRNASGYAPVLVASGANVEGLTNNDALGLRVEAGVQAPEPRRVALPGAVR